MEAETDPSPPSKRTKISPMKMWDLNEDCIARCATYLSNSDISNLAMTCKSVKQLVYSDSIWQRFFREKWPQATLLGHLPTRGARDSYMARLAALHQFKFENPRTTCISSTAQPIENLLLRKDSLVYSQGSFISMQHIPKSGSILVPSVWLSDHKARISCIRLFPLNETPLFQSESQGEENVVVTSSDDQSVRLWWKGTCRRNFRGHRGPVSVLSDRLLGDDSCRILVSGGADKTVRLWSLDSSKKRGQDASTLYGHKNRIKLISVAGHKTSHLVTVSDDSESNGQVIVWDTAAVFSGRSSCFYAMASVTGPPLDMKCNGPLLYVAAGSSVVGIDLRTMQKVITAAICGPNINSFDMLPMGLICTGGIDKALIWDIRRNQDAGKPKPVREMEGHKGPVTLLHMDPYKIVTGGPQDVYVNVWETNTGTQTNSLMCCTQEDLSTTSGCSGIAVNGCRIVTASCGEPYFIYRDYTDATTPCPCYN